jgi:hypothetical protein
MTCAGTWTLSGCVPDADFQELPGLHGVPRAQLDRAVDGAPGCHLDTELVRELHLQPLPGWRNWGFNAWFSTHGPIRTLADLRGMKLRSPGDMLNAWRIHFMGGIPNVTPWPDVPLAMSQGDFGGLISSNESARGGKPYDSGLRYSLRDEHALSYYVPMLNQALWTWLGPQLQHPGAVGGEPARLPRPLRGHSGHRSRAHDPPSRAVLRRLRRRTQGRAPADAAPAGHGRGGCAYDAGAGQAGDEQRRRLIGSRAGPACGDPRSGQDPVGRKAPCPARQLPGRPGQEPENQS